MKNLKQIKHHQFQTAFVFTFGDVWISISGANVEKAIISVAVLISQASSFFHSSFLRIDKYTQYNLFFCIVLSSKF
jgi:hypothetical protein